MCAVSLHVSLFVSDSVASIGRTENTASFSASITQSVGIVGRDTENVVMGLLLNLLCTPLMGIFAFLSK